MPGDGSAVDGQVNRRLIADSTGIVAHCVFERIRSLISAVRSVTKTAVAVILQHAVRGASDQCQRRGYEHTVDITVRSVAVVGQHVERQRAVASEKQRVV